MEITTLARNDIEMISKVESLGTWERGKYNFNNHNSYDIWSFGGKLYKIWKDSKRAE